MLKSLDVLIGISLVMLLVSMVVTVLTQFVTSLMTSHGRNLRDGLRDLIAHLDPALTREIAEEIASSILTNPMIADPPFLVFMKPQLGSIIHRNEFTKLLIELASPNSWTTLQPAALTALKDVLKKNDIPDPDATLNNIGTLALALEEAHPEWASSFRSDTAILQEAKNHFVGKINGWFDQTIDRVSARFTAEARTITFACGLILAVILQLDAVNILNTLWTNDAVRHDAVAAATRLAKEHSEILSDAQIKISENDIAQVRDFATAGLIIIPWGNSPWCTQFKAVKLPGIVLSAFLLSLGAPFWYNALKTLLRLRSQIADKDDAQRVARQTDGPIGPPPPDDGGSPVPSVGMLPPRLGLPGQRGDLGAVG